MAAEGDNLYCICKQPYDGDQFMIECNACKDWFHGSCVGIQEHQASDIDTYHCPACVKDHGPLTLKKRRNWLRHNYSDLNSGKKVIHSGTLAFISHLKKKKFKNCVAIVKLAEGNDLTLEYFECSGFNNPILVQEKSGLGLKVPSNDFTVADVERLVGSLRDIDVIDVARQGDLRMKLGQWSEYYESKPRHAVLNVISLEFSDTELSPLIDPPAVVRQMDWINCHWPPQSSDTDWLPRPQVQKYCLMSVENSYTDFHVDFGGTSVWYHVLRGEKIFYLIPPTTENIQKYEKWVLSASQSEVFFGDQVRDCYKCHIHQGNTLFIPTGWIHAVLTPVDSLVFGGNFLHSFNIGGQLMISNLEQRLQTPEKFLHPDYDQLNWFAAAGLVKQLRAKEENSVLPKYLTQGLQSLLHQFNRWMKNKEHFKLIPQTVNPEEIVQSLKYIILNEKKKQPLQVEVSKEEQHTMELSNSNDLSLKIKIKKAPVDFTYLETPELSDFEDTDHKDGDYTYLDLCEDEKMKDSDELWKPAGALSKSPSKRDSTNWNIGKRKRQKPSMQKSLAYTSAKLSKVSPEQSPMLQDHSYILPQSAQSSSYHVNQRRAKDAASSIEKLGPSVTKRKASTAKQRLGKILGLDKSASVFVSRQ